jgi:hypothetical protein
MALKISTQTADLMLSALATALNGGKINIYSGTEPLTANTALSGNTLLAELTFANPAFGAISASGNDRVMSANAIAQDTAANATGDATFFRATNTGNTTVYYQGTIGTTGQQLNLTATNIVADGVVSVSSMSITMPTA